MQPLSNSDTDATNRHSTISQTIQQPLSNPAPTIGNLNPSTTVLHPPDGRFRAWQKPTTQPSFVSNPRTIPTQPSHIRYSPTTTQPLAKGFVRRRSNARPTPDLLARPAVCGHPAGMILTRAHRSSDLLRKRASPGGYFTRALYAVVKITPGPQTCSRATVGSPALSIRSTASLPPHIRVLCKRSAI